MLAGWRSDLTLAHLLFDFLRWTRMTGRAPHKKPGKKKALQDSYRHSCRHRHRLYGYFVVTVIALLWSQPLRAQSARDASIDNAVRKGVKFLHNRVTRQPLITKPHSYALLAFETYALIVGDVSVDDPLIQKNFKTLRKQLGKIEECRTYFYSSVIFAADAAVAQLATDEIILKPGKVKLDKSRNWKDNPAIGKKYRKLITTCTEQLVKLQWDEGGWSYPILDPDDNGKPDVSNTQFAVLALGMAERRGEEVPDEVWLDLMRYLPLVQEDDGSTVKRRLTLEKKKRKKKTKRRGRKVTNPVVGTDDLEVFGRKFLYYPDFASEDWNMTCAGLSTAILTRARLARLKSPPGDWEKQHNVDFDALWETLDKAVVDAYGWIMGHWTPVKSYYGLYSLEKVADIGRVKKFGHHDWYREASDFLLEEQQPDGRWGGTRAYHEEDRVATAIAILVLKRATGHLTREAPTGMVVTGEKHDHDPDWVYVALWERQVHLPTILRALGRRSNSSSAGKILKEIVAAYPQKKRGELVPRILGIVSPSTKLPTNLSRCLKGITGVSYKDVKNYLEWYKLWKKVAAIAESKRKSGKKKKKRQTRTLLETYANPLDSDSLKELARELILRFNIRESVDLFLEELDDKQKRLRSRAYESIGALYTGSPPEFDPTAKGDERRKQIRAIRAWVKEQ